MSNNGTWIGYLGKDPEELQLGERNLMKLRIGEKAPGKRSTTRWFTALVGGPDVETAKRLRKGDQVALAGQMVLAEFKPGSYKPRYKGEVRAEDEMPFAKIQQVLKSPTFFEDDAADDADATAPATDAASAADADDPLAGL